ncbi:Rha family transcriptional regulator [Enterococcus sp. LJL99]
MKQLQQTINSREVAKMVGRGHKEVLRDTRKVMSQLDESKIALVDYFIESSYTDSKGEVRPCFDFTKKGCELYSTRMTGVKGTQFAVAYIERFNQMEEHIKSGKQHVSIDSETKRMNAEARLKNANSRQAKLLAELANDATTEVNKALLQDKAIESLIGEKLLEMPILKSKLYDSDQIAKRLGVLSKKRKPHGTAVSQIIQEYIPMSEDEFEILPETKNGWSGSVTKYAESVINRVESWIKDNNYPSVITGKNQNYHVVYEDIE